MAESDEPVVEERRGAWLYVATSLFFLGLAVLFAKNLHDCSCCDECVKEAAQYVLFGLPSFVLGAVLGSIAMWRLMTRWLEWRALATLTTIITFGVGIVALSVGYADG